MSVAASSQSIGPKRLVPREAAFRLDPQRAERHCSDRDDDDQRPAGKHQPEQPDGERDIARAEQPAQRDQFPRRWNSRPLPPSETRQPGARDADHRESEEQAGGGHGSGTKRNWALSIFTLRKAGGNLDVHEKKLLLRVRRECVPRVADRHPTGTRIIGRGARPAKGTELHGGGR